jgi:hypothetical protein
MEPSDTVHVTLSALPDGDNVRRVVDCSLAAGVGRLFLSGKILRWSWASKLFSS